MLSMQNLNWEKENQIQPYEGQQRQGFSITYVPDLQSILLFGGSHSKINQVHLYHIMKQQWTTQRTFFPKKMARKYHTAHYQSSIRALIVCGGQADKGRSLDTIDALFIDDWKWRKLALKNTPPPREYHSFTKLQSGNFLIFGGITLPYGTFLNDLWVIKGINQIRDSSTLQIPGCSANQIITKGTKPSGRHSHRGYAYGDQYFVIGGEGETYQQNFTVYSLHIKKLIWNKHNFNMVMPQLRGFSLLPNQTSSQNSICNYSEVFIFGGLLLNGKKPNRDIYCLDVSGIPKLRHISKCQANIPTQLLDNTCSLPSQQFCGISCCFWKGNKAQKQPSLELSKIWLKQQYQHLTMQEYLKQIKGQQILSQQLISKSSSLQALYRQIQGYISTLYQQYQQYAADWQQQQQQQCQSDRNYGNDGMNSSQQHMQIQGEKKQQIRSCLKLKQQYLKIEKAYNQNLMLLQDARHQLEIIDQNFEGCMETQRDQDL